MILFEIQEREIWGKKRKFGGFPNIQCNIQVVSTPKSHSSDSHNVTPALGPQRYLPVTLAKVNGYDGPPQDGKADPNRTVFLSFWGLYADHPGMENKKILRKKTHQEPNS